MTLAARSGGWIQTYTGRAFYPMDARPEDIDPADIAHALSMLCRYGGHVRRFYSVAEHCVLMSHAVSPENALWALLHDATEAYLVDLPRPIKRTLPDYGVAEQRLMYVIAQRFGIVPEEPFEVKQADNCILVDECERLMAKVPESLWQTPRLGVRIEALAPHFAEGRYLDRLRELTA